MAKIHENQSIQSQTFADHFLSEIEMQLDSNRKVLDPHVHQELEGLARDARNPYRDRAMALILRAALDQGGRLRPAPLVVSSATWRAFW